MGGRRRRGIRCAVIGGGGPGNCRRLGCRRDRLEDLVHHLLNRRREQARQLRHRQTQLESYQVRPPSDPSDSDLEAIRRHIHEVLGQGTPQVKKALYAALIEEIKILSDDTLQPVFRIPLPGDSKSRPHRSRLA
jgi:hypothetical protein